jgi:endonuclease III
MGIENAHQLIVFKIGPLSQLNRAFDSGIHGPELRAADIEEIADLLAASGLQNSKATRIRQLLRNLCDENSGGSCSAKRCAGFVLQNQDILPRRA